MSADHADSASAPPARAGEASDCPLCSGPGGDLVFDDGTHRVVVVDEPGLPGFVRVVLDRHAAEMTELPPPARDALMAVVWTVEKIVREVLVPDKINLASLGNQVPHLHWHVIPRWRDDPWFPAPIWAVPARPPLPLDGARRQAAQRLPAFHDALRAELRARY